MFILCYYDDGNMKKYFTNKERKHRIMNEYVKKQLDNVPKLTMENTLIVEAYEKALENLLCINTVPCSMDVYNKTGLLDENLPLMIRAGGGYETPWTRDASVNTMNAACFLEPEVAKNTLWAVCERVDGKLCFQLDNQKWVTKLLRKIYTNLY